MYDSGTYSLLFCKETNDKILKFHFPSLSPTLQNVLHLRASKLMTKHRREWRFRENNVYG